MRKIKTHILYLFTFALATISFGQDCEEFQIHYKSIDSTYHPGRIIDRLDTVFNSNKAFLNYTINNLLEKPSDSCFISNRKLLRKINNLYCDSSKIELDDTLRNGKQCNITISTGEFKTIEHQIEANKDTSSITKIDNQHPYGGEYQIPSIEIKQIKIQIEGRSIHIPKEAYSNFYFPLINQNNGFARKIEAYESLNGEYIYIYIYGGNAGSTYFAKLIFNKTNYLTKIACDYYALSIHGAFRKNFIGF